MSIFNTSYNFLIRDVYNLENLPMIDAYYGWRSRTYKHSDVCGYDESYMLCSVKTSWVSFYEDQNVKEFIDVLLNSFKQCEAREINTVTNQLRQMVDNKDIGLYVMYNYIHPTQYIYHEDTETHKKTRICLEFPSDNIWSSEFCSTECSNTEVKTNNHLWMMIYMYDENIKTFHCIVFPLMLKDGFTNVF
jgi:hypothetical protein